MVRAAWATRSSWLGPPLPADRAQDESPDDGRPRPRTRFAANDSAPAQAGVVESDRLRGSGSPVGGEWAGREA